MYCYSTEFFQVVLQQLYITKAIAGAVNLKLAGKLDQTIFFFFRKCYLLWKLKQITSLLPGDVTIIIRENCIKSSSSSFLSCKTFKSHCNSALGEPWKHLHTFLCCWFYKCLLLIYIMIVFFNKVYQKSTLKGSMEWRLCELR